MKFARSERLEVAFRACRFQRHSLDTNIWTILFRRRLTDGPSRPVKVQLSQNVTTIEINYPTFIPPTSHLVQLFSNFEAHSSCCISRVLGSQLRVSAALSRLAHSIGAEIGPPGSSPRLAVFARRSVPASGVHLLPCERQHGGNVIPWRTAQPAHWRGQRAPHRSRHDAKNICTGIRPELGRDPVTVSGLL